MRNARANIEHVNLEIGVSAEAESLRAGRDGAGDRAADIVAGGISAAADVEQVGHDAVGHRLIQMP